MKRLTLDEIRQFLTDEQIEDIISAKLIHPRTEEVLEKLHDYPTWTEHRRIYLSGDPRDNFTNAHWFYYRDKLRELKPLGLEINTNRLNSLPGIESFDELIEFSLGKDDPHEALYFNDELLSTLFGQLFKLPKLEKICIFFFHTKGGSITAHKEIIEKYHLRVKEVFPNAELAEDGDYFPIIIQLNREKITA